MGGERTVLGGPGDEVGLGVGVGGLSVPDAVPKVALDARLVDEDAAVGGVADDEAPAAVVGNGGVGEEDGAVAVLDGDAVQPRVPHVDVVHERRNPRHANRRRRIPRRPAPSPRPFLPRGAETGRKADPSTPAKRMSTYSSLERDCFIVPIRLGSLKTFS